MKTLTLTEIRGEKLEKSKGYSNKISYISAAKCSILQIWYQFNAKKTRQKLFNSLLVVLDNKQLRS